ncbi:DUF2121 domain-containing protein [Methanococcus voltae]|uniref:Uncharacterized protein n=2 Tax=Methanococcus voltae TaxID=2188 RepID=A0A8J7RHD4_METVO|nr:DUF2121 domain-containing protein [Methanococcus voltae]MBP2172713.1 hypothetical protein [Methanococcus voltae]MBP2201877.1 hypothetical protein [Methanococcus voltae]MCS3922701.1 hypothetical protein [Methanococcus voltae PS]
MSVIIGYYGNNGSAIAGDKRNILFRGSEENREKLESLLYEGKLKNDEELKEKALEYDVNVHITDAQDKVKKLDGCLMGEVKIISNQSKRKRMYLSKNSCALVKIIDDKITEKELKKGSGIIIFGNKHLKSLVQVELQKNVNIIKSGDILKIEKLFKNILSNIDAPSSSNDIDSYSNFNYVNLEKVIMKDLDKLVDYRNDLKNQIIKVQKLMLIEKKIATQGEIGYIENGKLKLYDKYLAIDRICENPTLYYQIDISGDVKDGDIIIIDDNNLKVKNKDVIVSVDKIICNK